MLLENRIFTDRSMTNDPERTGDQSDMDSVEDEDDNRTSNITSQILRRPAVLAALQDRFEGFDPRKMEVKIIKNFFHSNKHRFL